MILEYRLTDLLRATAAKSRLQGNQIVATLRSHVFLRNGSVAHWLEVDDDDVSSALEVLRRTGLMGELPSAEVNPLSLN